MDKHTQTICRLLPMGCLSLFDHFMGLALKGLIYALGYPKDKFRPLTKKQPELPQLICVFKIGPNSLTH